MMLTPRGKRRAIRNAQPQHKREDHFMTDVTRRALMAGSGLAAAAAALPALTTQAEAAAPAAGKQAPGIYRYKVGSYELTALHDGTWFRPIDEKFIKNVAWADVQNTLADNFFPASTLPLPFTPLLVNTGSKLVLIDTGSAGQLAPTAPGIGPTL